MSNDRKTTVQFPTFRHTVARQMADYRSRLARNIERERLRHGQNTEDIARQIDVTKRTFERWEEDASAPQPANLLALAEAWGVEIDDLRPDLKREAETLARVEAKLDLLLVRAGLPVDFESVVRTLETTIAEVGQPKDSTGLHNGEQPPASEK